MKRFVRRLILGLALAAMVGGVPAEARRSHYYVSPQSGTDDYYTAHSGHRVHRPVQASAAPAGASARCRDGAWSFSESRRGTCSHHGGVASWR